jgi:hypothetical protein
MRIKKSDRKRAAPKMADKSDSDEEYVPSKPCDLYQEA